MVFVHYALLALDIRFVTAKNYAGIMMVNTCIAFNTWYMTRRIVTAQTVLDRVAFIGGGTAGAVIAVGVS